MSTSKSKLDPYTTKAQNDHLTPMEKIKGLKDIIRSTETAMLTTRSADGSFHSRAMNPIAPESDTDLTLTFIANHVSSKFDEIQNDSHVNVSFLNPSTSDWASFSGKAKVIEDRDKIKQRWSKGASAWFGDLKDGVHKGDADDERVALIQVVPSEIRYWHATKGKLGTALQGGIDAMTGGVTVPGELRTITSDEDMDAHSKEPCTNGRGLLGIPAEILSTILELSKRMTDELLKDSRTVSEITLSHICTLLRNVALTSPRLWATIQIHPLSSPHRIMEYVRRSGACPLDLRIEFTDRYSFAIQKDMEFMLDLVVKQSFRWRSLSAECIRACTGCPTITRIGESSARALQHLSLDIEDVEHIDAGVAARETGRPHIFEDGAPKLKFVRLRGLAIQVFRPPLDIVAIGLPMVRLGIYLPDWLTHGSAGYLSARSLPGR